MKTRWTATCTALALAALAVQPVAHAGDREWAVAGKVLTGIAAVGVISRLVEPAPTVVYQPAPVVYQTVVAPPPPQVTYVPAAPVAPAAPVYAPAPAPVAPTTAVVYQSAPAVVYVAAPAPVYVAPPPVVIAPYGYYHRPYHHHFSRW